MAGLLHFGPKGSRDDNVVKQLRKLCVILPDKETDVFVKNAGIIK
jgi:hypothetical protein